MNPLISVIVPVYNTEPYLRTCINSIVNQSFTDLEILIIDDGSNDNSGKICDELALTDDRISVYHKENGGLSVARNYGLKKASGLFYAFVDSDDCLHKDFFKVLINSQRKNKADIVSTDILMFDDFKQIIEESEDSFSELVFNRDEAIKEYFKPSGERKIYHGFCMKLYKKELFDEIEFPAGRLHEDLYVTYRLINKCNRFVYLDLPYYYYFQNPSGICNNYTEDNFNDECDAYFEIYSFFKDSKYEKEVLFFLTFQFLDAFTKASHFIDDVHNSKRKEESIKWLRSHVWNIEEIPLYKKLYFTIFLRNIRLFVMIRNIRNKIKTNE